MPITDQQRKLSKSGEIVYRKVQISWRMNGFISMVLGLNQVQTTGNNK